MFYLILPSIIAISSVESSFLPFSNNHINASVGGHAVFNCHLDFPFGIEIPYQIEWYKESDLIFSWNSMTDPWEAVYADNYGGRIQHLKNKELGLGRGSINLTSIRETDNGNYHCLVIFPNRTPNTRNNGTYYYLEVDGGNLIVTPPINVTCMEGERAEFECVPKSPEAIVKWFKDGEAISDLMDLAYRSITESNGSLILEHTSMTDPGEYECRVVNDLGEMQSASAFLNVQYKAKIVYAPKERFLAYGKPASLDCFYRANPPLTNLRWEKDGFLFDPYNVPGVFYSRNGSLLFNKADETHEGHYSCIPYNQLGTEGPSPKTHVIVQKPPVFTIRPHRLYVTKVGDTVTMNCGASDSNNQVSPIITWSRKDGGELPKDRYSLDGGNITINDIEEDDYGMYVCTASNEAGIKTAETEIVVENVTPGVPYNVTANATKDAIQVNWVPGYTRQRVNYHVWYRPTNSSEWRTLKAQSQSGNEAIVSNVQPGLEYEIRVLTQDTAGDGFITKPLFVRTVEDNSIASDAQPSYMSTGPPANLTASYVPEGILLTWAAPDYGAEHLKRYVVRWYLGPEEHLRGSHETSNTYFLITDVQEDEQYAFVVFSLATNDSLVSSDKVVLDLATYSRIRSAVVVTGSVLVFIGVTSAILYFGREKICNLRNSLTDGKCNGR